MDRVGYLPVRPVLDELEALSVALATCQSRAVELVTRVAAMENGPHPTALKELLDVANMAGYASKDAASAHKIVNAASEPQEEGSSVA